MLTLAACGQLLRRSALEQRHINRASCSLQDRNKHWIPPEHITFGEPRYQRHLQSQRIGCLCGPPWLSTVFIQHSRDTVQQRHYHGEPPDDERRVPGNHLGQGLPVQLDNKPAQSLANFDSNHSSHLHQWTTYCQLSPAMHESQQRCCHHHAARPRQVQRTAPSASTTF